MKSILKFTSVNSLCLFGFLFSLNVHALQLEAQYEVPVTDSSLAADAMFRMSPVKMTTQANGETTLKVKLPKSLTGVSNTYRYSGYLTSGTSTLKAAGYGDDKEYSLLQCTSDDSLLNCKAEYQEIQIDDTKALSVLQNQFTGNQLQNRIRVQRRFSADPVGFIKIKLK